MNSGRHRSGRLLGLAATALVASAAGAQQTVPPQTAPVPTSTPSRPAIITLPGGADRFDLRRAGPQASVPTPTPTPAATPALVPPPIARVTPAPIRTPEAPQARPTPRADRAPVAAASPTPDAAAPPPAVAPSAAPATPVPVPVETPAPAASAPAPDRGGWPLAPFAILAVAVLGLLGWWFLRRRRAGEATVEEVAPAPPPRPAQATAPAPPRPVPPAPPRPAPLASPPMPRPAPEPVRAPALPSDPIHFELRPLQAALVEQGLVLDLELLVGNPQPVPADALRVTLAVLSANPQQDAVIEGYHLGQTGDPVAPPFDLAPGGGGRLTARLGLDRANFHVMDVGGRPMIVPLVLIDVRWRGGLSIRRHGADFILGSAGQGSKLGPVWLDRATNPIGRLVAQRYFRKSAVQAAE